jgi:hypothetical protein
MCNRSRVDEPPCEHQRDSILPALPHTYLLVVIYTTVDQHRLREVRVLRAFIQSFVHADHSQHLAQTVR